MALIPKTSFPDVPNLPGVPQLQRRPQSATQAIRLLQTSGVLQNRLWEADRVTPVWGIFDSRGQIVLNYDSVLDFSYRNESSVSGFPIQRGAFANYNKVANPYETTLRFSKGGTQADRTVFLDQLDRISKTLDLYTILTPEKTYSNANVLGMEIIRRGPKNAFFLTDVDVRFIEIRQVTPQYTSFTANTANAKNPSAQPPLNQGMVQFDTPEHEAEFNASQNLKVKP